MSTHSREQVGTVPEWDLADRLAKALRVAGISREQMAAYLGVSPNTVSNYTGGHTTPKKLTLRAWADRCGVDLEWLETGKAPRPGGPDGGARTSSGGRRARHDSNVQPSDPKVRPLVVSPDRDHLYPVAA